MDRESIINEYIRDELRTINVKIDRLDDKVNAFEKRLHDVELKIDFIKAIFTKKWVWIGILLFLVFVMFLDPHPLINFIKTISGAFH